MIGKFKASIPKPNISHLTILPTSLALHPQHNRAIGQRLPREGIFTYQMGRIAEFFGMCWIKTDKNFVWSFLGPVSFILTFNLILFIIIIIITLRTTLAGLNTEHSKIKEIK
ncbi:hypothetical protein MHYP_G00101420 [Metynnis hypsauchen]